MNHYETLGVEKTASDAEIKQAYRRKAQQHHPDRSGGDDAEFKKIAAAYDVLSDTAKRKAYDESGGDAALLAAAQQVVRGVFRMFLAQAQPGELLSDARNHIEDQIRQGNAHMMVVSHKLAVAQRRASEVVPTNNATNLFEEVIIEQLTQAKAEHLEMANKLKVFKHALAILEKYRSNVTPTNRYGGFTSTTSTGGGWMYGGGG